MLADLIKVIFKKDKVAKKSSSRGSDTLAYWQSRARKFGKRAVINVDHPVDQFDEIKNRDKNVIFPHLKKFLTGRENLILDFGCGLGRFTNELASVAKCKAVGVDPTKELIKLAPPAKHVEYFVMKKGKIPLSAESVDLIWIYAVLGCIPDQSLNQTFMELNRVLKKNGVLFLIENTTAANNSAYYTFRSLKEYLKVVPFASMKHQHDYFDVGKGFEEKFSIMAGYKKN